MLLHLAILVLLGWYLLGALGGLSWTALQVLLIAGVVAGFGDVLLARVTRREPLLT